VLETGQPGLRSLAHSYHAAALDVVGEHDEGARLTQLAFDLGQQAAMPDALNFYGAAMWVHWIYEDQLEVAALVADQAFAEYPTLVAWQGAGVLARVLAGRDDEAVGVLARAPDVPVDMFWLITQAFFAAAQGFGVEHPETAGTTYEALLPYRALHAAYGIGYLGPVEIVLGTLARVLGDPDAALAHHETAAAAIESCGAARARAFNDYQRARALLARDAPGDRRRAAELTGENLAYCRAKGYSTFVRQTEELLGTMD
jgi:hypothetical protein